MLEFWFSNYKMASLIPPDRDHKIYGFPSLVRSVETSIFRDYKLGSVLRMRFYEVLRVRLLLSQGLTSRLTKITVLADQDHIRKVNFSGSNFTINWPD